MFTKDFSESKQEMRQVYIRGLWHKNGGLWFPKKEELHYMLNFL